MFIKKKMNEECGVFGVYNHKNAVELTYYGLNALQHRGQEGTGIVSSDGLTLKQHKGEGLVKNVFTKTNLEALKGIHAIGHVRYSTSGGGGILNVQPFLFHSTKGPLGLCHNGNLVNATPLKAHLEQQGSLFQTTSDTEILAHLLKRNRGTFTDRLKESLLYLEGAFAFLLLLEDSLYVALDKHGLRPLSLATLDGAYIVSSETCGIDAVGATYLRDVLPGEIVKISKEGLVSTVYAYDTTHEMCMMEFVYFARPDSIIEGTSVYEARKRAGRVLALEAPADADVVIGVPDSGLTAASGYALESKIPLETGMIKNKYAGRTFIEPSQDLREQGVMLKLSAIRAVVENKRVVLVDDSIVRGTTIKKLIDLLKKAKAKEVHVRIASPEIKYPCFYGVDFSTYDELISTQYTPTELADYIGADSVAFLSLDGLFTSLERKNKSACMACFNKKYPTHLYEAIEKANKVIK